MEHEAVRISDLVIEAGALMDWLDTGRGDFEIVGAALLYLRDELSRLADDTSDPDACQAACGMVASINEVLTHPPVGQRHRAA